MIAMFAVKIFSGTAPSNATLATLQTAFRASFKISVSSAVLTSRSTLLQANASVKGTRTTPCALSAIPTSL